MRNGCLFWWKPKPKAQFNLDRLPIPADPARVEYAKRQLLAFAEDAMRQGARRQDIYDDLFSEKMETRDLSILHGRSAALHELLSVMVDRNLMGKELEEKGKIDQAVALYEANVADGFNGTHPYTRLRVIYTKQKNYFDAARVCQAYIALPKAGKKEDFQHHLSKLQAKL